MPPYSFSCRFEDFVVRNMFVKIPNEFVTAFQTPFSICKFSSKIPNEFWLDKSSQLKKVIIPSCHTTSHLNAIWARHPGQVIPTSSALRHGQDTLSHFYLFIYCSEYYRQDNPDKISQLSKTFLKGKAPEP